MISPGMFPDQAKNNQLNFSLLARKMDRFVPEDHMEEQMQKNNQMEKS